LSEFIIGLTVKVDEKEYTDANNELLSQLFSLLHKAQKYPTTTLGYFSKCILSLLRSKPAEVHFILLYIHLLALVLFYQEFLDSREAQVAGQ